MKYDFETMTNRSDAGSYKWMGMYSIKPETPKDIVPLSMADMEFKNPPQIVTAMKDYIDTYPLGYNCITPSYLRSIQEWMRNRHAWEVKKEWILPITGVLNGVYATIQAFTKPGEGVIYFSPVFALFRSGIVGNERIAVPCSLSEQNDGWQINFDELERKASDPNNKIMLVCNPHNPLARIWTKDELVRMGEICVKHNVLIISDEIHSDLVMPGYTHITFGGLSPEIDNQLIVCTAPTKTFNLASVQAGNMIIPNSLLYKRVEQQLANNGLFTLTAMGFVATETAYSQCGDWLDECIDYVYENHKTVVQYTKQHMPKLVACEMQATYLQWLDFRAICSDPKELEHKLQAANVFLDMGNEFGPEGEGFARMNLACSKEIILETMDRIRNAF